MDDISNAIILLVRVGAVARFIYCLVRLTAAEEQAAQYKKRARNTVIFYIIAESIWQIKDLILYYWTRKNRSLIFMRKLAPCSRQRILKYWSPLTKELPLTLGKCSTGWRILSKAA